MNQSIKVCALLTAFNRREKTLAALRAFFSSGGDVRPDAVLMDDGSTDGTADAVKGEFNGATVLRGDGSLFWNRGMAQAFQAGLVREADYYLWLNDDTVLFPGAVESLLEDAAGLDQAGGCIVVGSTRDPESGDFTYGGVRSVSTWHPGKFERIPPHEDAVQACDAMNGNIVLISAAAARTVGGIDPRFRHSMGDYDYGLRANRQGVSVVIGRGYHGHCPRNPAGSAWHEKTDLRARWRQVNSPKGLPPREWAYFLRKHGSILWPLAWCATYRKIITG